MTVLDAYAGDRLPARRTLRGRGIRSAARPCHPHLHQHCRSPRPDGPRLRGGRRRQEADLALLCHVGLTVQAVTHELGMQAGRIRARRYHRERGGKPRRLRRRGGCPRHRLPARHLRPRARRSPAIRRRQSPPAPGQQGPTPLAGSDIAASCGPAESGPHAERPPHERGRPRVRPAKLGQAVAEGQHGDRNELTASSSSLSPLLDIKLDRYQTSLSGRI